MDDIVEQLKDMYEYEPAGQDSYREAIDEIERLRKRDAVLELFAKAFHVDEFGQFPVTNGEDVWAAVLAYAQMRVEETRRG